MIYLRDYLAGKTAFEAGVELENFPLCGNTEAGASRESTWRCGWKDAKSIKEFRESVRQDPPKEPKPTGPEEIFE